MATGFDVAGFRFGDYGNPGSQHVPGVAAQEHLGWADITAAREQGKASNFQIWQLYDRAVRERDEQQREGWTGPGGSDPLGRFALSIGGPVESRIKSEIGPRTATPFGWKFETRGGYGYDMADIADITTLQEKEILRDFANQHGLAIGAGVDQHITDLQQERSAAQRDERHRLHQQGLADQQAARDAERLAQEAAFQQQLLAQQEAAAARAARVTGSSPTGVGGAASIKGSRLSITEAGGRKGTKRFARPTQFMNTLGINASGTGSAGKAPITL